MKNKERDKVLEILILELKKSILANILKQDQTEEQFFRDKPSSKRK